MDFTEDPDHRLIREAVRETCARFPDEYWAELDESHTFPWEFYDAMAKGGWIGIAIPAEYGGGGRGITEASIVLEEVAASGACMNGASSIHLSIFGMHPVVRHGSGELKQRHLPRVATGDLHVAFGVTEPDAGLDTTAIRTRAVRVKMYRGNWPTGRLDMRLADENHFFFRWSQSITSSVTAGTTGEVLDTTQEHKYSSMMASDTETVTPYLIHHFLFGYNTDTVLQGQGVGKETPGTGDNAVNSLGIQGTNADDHSVQGFPSITVSGLTPLEMPAGGGADNNVAENDSILTLRDDVAWSKAGHAFKIGGDFTRFNLRLGEVPLLNYGAFNFTGMFTGLGFADFLLGLPATSGRILQPRVDDKVKQTLGGAYITDSFRVTPKLTLDYGVRWDYFGSPRYNDGYMWNWNPTTGSVVVAPGTLTYVNEYYPTNISVVSGNPVPKAKTTNLRPRIAAAYRLSDNLVLRGGFGEFTDGGGFGANGRINNPDGSLRLP